MIVLDVEVDTDIWSLHDYSQTTCKFAKVLQTLAPKHVSGRVGQPLLLGQSQRVLNAYMAYIVGNRVSIIGLSIMVWVSIPYRYLGRFGSLRDPGSFLGLGLL